MKAKTLTVPEIGELAVTRVALGVGIGLVLADKLQDERRKKLGWTLFAVGALSTFPIVANILGKQASANRAADLAEAIA
jgi:hypothetical protein